MRSDPEVSQAGLSTLGLDTVKADDVQVMDSVAYIPDIQRVDEAYANKYVSLTHL